MSKLDDARENINIIDEEMAKLFEKRMKAVEDIAKYKKENSLPVLDEKREEEVVKKNLSFINDPVIREYYKEFLKEVMNESKKYQNIIINDNKNVWLFYKT